MNAGSPEDVVIKWLDSTAEDWGDVFIHYGEKALHHPYFIVACLAVLVYLMVAARKNKRR